MAAVKIDTGPVSAEACLEFVPPDKWRTLLSARRSFVKTNIPYDCRTLLQFVDEAEQMYEALGYSDVADLIRRGLEIDPKLVDWAIKGLKSLKPDEPVTLKTAVQLGKHGGARPGAGRPKADEPRPEPTNNQPCDLNVDYGSTNHWVARAERDRPDLAERIRSGELSPNAAAVEAGWRKPPLLKRDPLAAIVKLVERLAADDRIDLKHRLEPLFLDAEAQLLTGMK